MTERDRVLWKRPRSFSLAYGEMGRTIIEFHDSEFWKLIVTQAKKHLCFMESGALLSWFRKPTIGSCAEPVESYLRHNNFSNGLFIINVSSVYLSQMASYRGFLISCNRPELPRNIICSLLNPLVRILVNMSKFQVRHLTALSRSLYGTKESNMRRLGSHPPSHLT
jgi:hypothetical protein